jgi:hypothetical protein
MSIGVQLTPADGRILQEMATDWRGATRQQKRSGKRNWSGVSNALVDTVRKGRVSSATAATFEHDGDVQIDGEIEVWERILPSEVEPFSPTEDYITGNFVRFTAGAYDEDTSYSGGDFALYSGSVYEANTSTTGTWDAGDWDLIDTAGIKRAKVSISAGDYTASEWDDVDDEADELIDRNEETVTVPNPFDSAPVEGARIEWDSQGIRVLTCHAPEDWE